MVRLLALRRAAIFVAVSAAAVIVLPGNFVDGLAPAGATAAPTATIPATISATNPLPVPSTGTGVTAGSLTITLSAAGSLTSGTTLALFVTASSGTVHWKNYKVSASGGISYSSTMSAGNDLNIILGAKVATHVATIVISGIKLTTSSVAGTISVSPTLNGVTFTPPTVSDGPVVQTPPSAPTITLTSSSQPQLRTGESAGAAGTWELSMSGDITRGSGWAAGSVLTIAVSPPSGVNCAGNGYLYFVGTPAATVPTPSGVSATPSLALSLGSGGTCSASQPDELKVTFENTAYFDTTTKTTVQVAITGVHYTVGATAKATGTGGVIVDASFSATPSTVLTGSASNAIIEATPTTSRTTTKTKTTTKTTTPTHTSTTTPTHTKTSTSTPLVLRADTPQVSVPPDAYDAQISSVHVVESLTAHVPVGYVCLTLSSATFNTTAPASVAVSSGNGAASASVQYQGELATAAPTAELRVTRASTSAGELTVSGLAVDAGTRAGPVAVVATYGSSASCAVDSAVIGSATAFTVISTPVSRIYGATSDATAAAELENQFDAQGTACPGRPGARPVVLATDAHFADALTAAYLASSLGTGELLTPTAFLSAVTMNAIRLEGITEVYIVGGPLAVSPAVANDLESALAYNCGGTTLLTSNGPVHIEVVRIAGATEYDTAQWVAEYPAASNVGSLDVAGAYVGTDRTGGTGRYNDTAGNASRPPGTSSTLSTAIVATGRTFQDAESASVLSFSDRLPILLTTTTTLSPQVASVITSLGIEQVLVMGGPLAITDTVVSSLESLGVSVLRIGGQDATDTAVQLADFEMASKSGHMGAGWTGNGGVAVARGNYFTDGLAGAIVAAGGGRAHTHQPEPLLLCENPTTVGPYLSAFLSEAGRSGIDGNAADRVTSLTILGGPQAVSQSVVTTMTGDL